MVVCCVTATEKLTNYSTFIMEINGLDVEMISAQFGVYSFEFLVIKSRNLGHSK